MIHRNAVLMLLLANLAFGSDEASSVRSRERALAAAINSHDQNAIESFLDSAFKVSWSFGSAIKYVHSQASRQEWMDGIGRLRTDSYRVEIEGVRPAETRKGDGSYSSAFVRLTEHWTAHTPQAERIHKRIETQDR